MLQELRRAYYPLVMVRDCMAVPWTDNSKAAHRVSGAIGKVIPSHMTPVSCLGDTHFHGPGKCAAERVKEVIRLEHESILGSMFEKLICKVEDVMRVCEGFYDECVELNESKEMAIRGMRENGELAYRPGQDG